MNGTPNERIEAQLLEYARHFVYPPTPDISGRVVHRLAAHPVRSSFWYRRRLAWGAVAILIILGTLLAVPPVRAAIVDFIQVGVVRIFLPQPTLAHTPEPQPTSPGEIGGASNTPLPSQAFLPHLSGEITLAEALDRLDFPVFLPTYPADLGPPDGVFLQDMDGQVLVLIWMDPENAEKVRFSLHQMEPGNYSIEKVNPTILEETSVHGEVAYWTTGPYILKLRSGDPDFLRLIDGHVLIWTEGEITFRLETDLPLGEAIRIAESLTATTR